MSHCYENERGAAARAAKDYLAEIHSDCVGMKQELTWTVIVRSLLEEIATE